ncbi:MAG: hypothetical protein M3P26_10550 [Gemmatimonadota bacterium]|nr:hypothetical protein [Gemmatimonadota bacterium]
MTQRREFLKTVLLFGLIAACNPSALFAPRAIRVPRSFFGHMVPGYIVAADGGSPIDISIGTLRMWDGPTWEFIDEQGPSTNWSGFDGFLTLAERLNAEPLFVFGRPPVYQRIAGTGSPTPEAWESFIDRVLDRGAGRIKLFETWNEPATEGPCPEEMMELARILRARVPNALLLTPSFNELTTYGAAFADEYLRLGGARYADVIAFHSYSADVTADIRVLRSLMAKHKVDLPLWNTETVGIASLEQQAREGVERVVLNAQIRGNEDWNSSTPLGLEYQTTYNRMVA